MTYRCVCLSIGRSDSHNLTGYIVSSAMTQAAGDRTIDFIMSRSAEIDRNPAFELANGVRCSSPITRARLVDRISSSAGVRGGQNVVVAEDKPPLAPATTKPAQRSRGHSRMTDAIASGTWPPPGRVHLRKDFTFLL